MSWNFGKLDRLPSITRLMALIMAILAAALVYHHCSGCTAGEQRIEVRDESADSADGADGQHDQRLAGTEARPTNPQSPIANLQSRETIQQTGQANVDANAQVGWVGLSIVSAVPSALVLLLIVWVIADRISAGRMHRRLIELVVRIVTLSHERELQRLQGIKGTGIEGLRSGADTGPESLSPSIP